MAEIFNMAVKGRVYIFGNRENKINPIHETNVAKMCVDAIDMDKEEISLGGPEIFTYTEIAETAFEVLGKKPKIVRIPAWLAKTLTLPLRLIKKSIMS